MSVSYVPYNLTPEQVTQPWDGYAAGQTVSQLARRFGEKQGSMYSRMQASDGIPPTMPRRASRHLTFEDREEISRGLAAGDSCATSPRSWGVQRRRPRGGRQRRRTWPLPGERRERASVQRRKRPEPCKLATTPRLARLVEAKLRLRCPLKRSPAGSSAPTPTGRSCRCRTRRSTAPSTCSPAGPSNVN
jgi:hypothetical protein